MRVAEGSDKAARLFAVNRLQAAAIEVKQVRDRVVALRRCTGDEARSGRRRAANVRRNGNKLQQIEGDIFIAARTSRGRQRRFDGQGIPPVSDASRLDWKRSGGVLTLR